MSDKRGAMERLIQKVKVHRGWADVGSHGGIFAFTKGPVGDSYPGLLHIFKDKVTPDLVEVKISPVNRKKVGNARCVWREDENGVWKGGCGHEYARTYTERCWRGVRVD